jgi:hypothetical protein
MWKTSVLAIDNCTLFELKHDLRQKINSNILARHTTYLWWIWLRSMNCSIVMNKCLALVIKRNNGLQSGLGPNQEFRVWLVDLKHICAKYSLEIWLTPSDNISICALDMQLSCTKNGKEIWIATTKQLVYILLTYSLSVLKIISKQFALRLIKFVVFTTTQHRKFPGKVTFDKWWNSYNYEWLPHSCAEYGLQTWFAHSQRNRALDIRPPCDN